MTIGEVDNSVIAVASGTALAAHSGASRLGGSFADREISASALGVDSVGCAERFAMERFGVGMDTLV